MMVCIIQIIKSMMWKQATAFVFTPINSIDYNAGKER